MNMKKILIAEDEVSVRRSINTLLNSAGYIVEEAKDGHEALEKLSDSQSNSCPFDLLLADIIMPGMTGLELIDEIRKRRMGLPIIVITAFGDHRMQTQLLGRGFSDFISKPFEADELFKRVAQAFKEEKRIQADGDEGIRKQMTHSRDLKE